MRSMLIGVVALAVTATPVLAESWNSYSRTDTRAYLADADSIATVDGVTSIRAASAPMSAAAGDLSHTRETYQFQCAAEKWRTAGMTEYEPDGSAGETYPEEGAEWESIRPNTVPALLKQIACDGARAQGQTWPTVQAFIAAGRPRA
jgi:hypothetical protein